MDDKYIKYGNYYYLKDKEGIDASKAYIKDNNGNYSLYNNMSRPYELKEVVVTPKPTKTDLVKRALKQHFGNKINDALDNPIVKNTLMGLDVSRHVGAGMQGVYNMVYPNNNSNIKPSDYYKGYGHPGILPGSGANMGATIITDLLPVSSILGKSVKGLRKAGNILGNSNLELTNKANKSILFSSDIEGVRPYLVRWFSKKFGNGLPVFKGEVPITESTAKIVSDDIIKKSREEIRKTASRLRSVQKGKRNRIDSDFNNQNRLLDLLEQEDRLKETEEFLKTIDNYKESMFPSVSVKPIDKRTKGLYYNEKNHVIINSNYPENRRTLTLIHEDQHAIDRLLKLNDIKKREEILNKVFKTKGETASKSHLVSEKSAVMSQLKSSLKEYAKKYGITEKEALKRLGKNRIREHIIDLNAYGQDYARTFDDESFSALTKYINTLKKGGLINK